MSKRALFVGIDRYVNPAKGTEDPEWALQGCVADAKSFRRLVTTWADFGFGAADTRLLLDEAATRAGIREALGWLLDETAYTGRDDVRLFYFAGHGTYVADDSGDEAGPGGERDEVLVTYDHSWEEPLRDDELRAFFDRIPDEVTFTFIADCCHSGTLQHEDVPQPIDPLSPEETPPPPLKTRYLPPPQEILDQVDERRHENLHRLQREVEALPRDRAETYMQELEERFEVLGGENRFGYVSTDRHVLLAACRDVEYSKEIRTDTGAVRGAFTWSLEQALTGAGKPLTYRQLVELAASRLRSQTPQLECPTGLRDRAFLAPHPVRPRPDAPTPEPDPEPAPGEPKPQPPPPTDTPKEETMSGHLVRFLTVLGSQDKKGDDGFWSKDWSDAQRELAMRMAGLSAFEKALVKKRDSELIDGYLRQGGGRPIGQEGGGGRPIGQEGGGGRPIGQEGGGDRPIGQEGGD